MQNEQENFWKGSFGNQFIKRNTFETHKKFNNFYIKRYGCSRDFINNFFLKKINLEKPVLEVGCNIGNQLNALSRIGFKNLYGIDINNESLTIVKKNTNLNIIKSSGFNIPFKDSFFNIVFTSFVLIHIHPKNLKKIMAEIYRVSNNYIYGLEYYNNDLIEINYRNYKNKAWKGDYCKLYLKTFKKLKLVKERIYQNKDNLEDYDKIFLLKKS